MWQNIHVIAIAKGTRGHEQRPARDFGGIRHQNVARYGDNCLQTTIECQDLLTLSNGFDLRPTRGRRDIDPCNQSGRTRI
jgi:hypothetical protein